MKIKFTPKVAYRMIERAKRIFYNYPCSTVLDEWKEKLKIWEDEQNVYNWILWGQGVNVDQVHDPKMAFQAHMMAGPDHNVDAANQWNNLHINDSHIIHWHSSRGPENRIATMTEVNRRTGVAS